MILATFMKGVWEDNVALAQTTLKLTRKPANEGAKKSKDSKDSAAQKKVTIKTNARKVDVDLDDVPTLGGSDSQTEAGVSLPGFVDYAGGPAGPLTSNGGYWTPSASSDSGNNLLGNAAGIIQLFATAQNLANIANPNGTGPLFKGECVECAEKEKELLRAQPHEPEVIMAAINKESVIPFADLPEDQREAYKEYIIESLTRLGELTLQNTSEYESLCPNYEELDMNQRKAFMVFLYSEIFKQTSNYDHNSFKPQMEDGVQKNRIGLCQLEYNEVALNFKQLDQDLGVSEENFATDFAYAPEKNIYACSLRIYYATQDVSGKSERPLQKMFPHVKFAPIKATFEQLKMCDKNQKKSSDTPPLTS